MALELSCTRQTDDSCIVRLEGRLDAHAGPGAYQRILEQLGDRSRVVLDLEELEYISSGGISIIIRLTHHLRSRGGEVSVAGFQPFVRKVFDIVSFDAILPLYEDVDAAWEELQ